MRLQVAILLNLPLACPVSLHSPPGPPSGSELSPATTVLSDRSLSPAAFDRAKALQTVIQLMGERNLYEYWADTYKTHSMDWSLGTAKAILDAWQLKFTQVSAFFGTFIRLMLSFYMAEIGASMPVNQNWLKTALSVRPHC